MAGFKEASIFLGAVSSRTFFIFKKTVMTAGTRTTPHISIDPTQYAAQKKEEKRRIISPLKMCQPLVSALFFSEICDGLVLYANIVVQIHMTRLHIKIG